MKAQLIKGKGFRKTRSDEIHVLGKPGPSGCAMTKCTKDDDCREDGKKDLDHDQNWAKTHSMMSSQARYGRANKSLGVKMPWITARESDVSWGRKSHSQDIDTGEGTERGEVAVGRCSSMIARSNSYDERHSSDSLCFLSFSHMPNDEKRELAASGSTKNLFTDN
jgi:hypothetical protein